MRPSGNDYKDLAAHLAKTLEAGSYNAAEQAFTLLKNYCDKAKVETVQLSNILTQHANFLGTLLLKHLFQLAPYFDAHCPIEWKIFIESIEDQAKQEALKKENELRNALQDLAYSASVLGSDPEKYNQKRIKHNDKFRAYKRLYTGLTIDPYPPEHGAAIHLLAIQTRYLPGDKLDSTEFSLNTPPSPHLNQIDEDVVEVRCTAVTTFIRNGCIRIKADRPIQPSLQSKPSARKSLFSSLSNAALLQGPSNRLSRSSSSVLDASQTRQQETLSTGDQLLGRSDSLQFLKKLDLKGLGPILNGHDPEPDPMPEPTLTQTPDPTRSDSTQIAEPLLTDKKSTSQLIIDPTRLIIGAAIALAITTVALSLATGGLAAIPMFSMALVMGASAFTGAVAVEGIFQSAEKIKQRVNSVAKFLDKINVDPTEVLIGAGMAIVIVASVVAMTVATGGLAIPALAAVAAIAALVLAATAGSFSFVGICRSIAGKRQPASPKIPASPQSAWVRPQAATTPRTEGTQFVTVAITP